MKSISTNLSNKLITPLQTQANNADPRMSVTVVRAKDTIMDNTYWTTEVIRTGANLGDLSVAPRRRRVSGGPDGLFNIYIQNGAVKTAYRDYPDLQKLNWQDQFELGPGSAVAMAFDGHWERYKKLWRLITHNKPWIFWVDSLNVLWAQLWDDESTKQILDIDVVKVRALRGWRNIEYRYLDQGIVVAYIKNDGSLYYRNYCVQEDDSTIWEQIRRVDDFTGVAVNLNLFITIDYRAGVIIEDNTGQIYWLVSHRNWAGMASPVERIHASIDSRDVTLEIIPIGYYDAIAPVEHISASINSSDVDLQICPFDFTIDNVNIVSAKRMNNHQIKIEFTHNLLNVSATDFKVTNMIGVEFNIVSATLGVTMKSIILTTSEVLPSIGIFPVTYTQGDLRVEITSSCRPLMRSFNVDATGEPPQVQENISVNIEGTVDIIRIYYTSCNAESDFISTSINATDVTLQIYKVEGGTLIPL